MSEPRTDARTSHAHTRPRMTRSSEWHTRSDKAMHASRIVSDDVIKKLVSQYSRLAKQQNGCRVVGRSKQKHET